MTDQCNARTISSNKDSCQFSRTTIVKVVRLIFGFIPETNRFVLVPLLQRHEIIFKFITIVSFPIFPTTSFILILSFVGN
jgi:hypothetical protein